jgi:hypothetical protein
VSIGQRIMLRVLSALVALALIAGACLLIGQVVVGMTGGGDFLVPTAHWYDALRETPWGDASVVYTGTALLVTGLLVIVVVVLTRPRLFTLARPEEAVEVVIAPRAVAQMLRRQAEAVPGVGAASVEVSRVLARISVTAPLASPEKVEQSLAEALAHGLKQVPWTRVPRLEIEVIGSRDLPHTPPSSNTRPPSDTRPPSGPQAPPRLVEGAR